MASSRNRSADIDRAVRALVKSELLVGISGESAGRGDDAINNVALGYLFETGEPATNMPPRPWLRPGVESIRDEIVERLGAVARDVIVKAVQQPGYGAKPDIERALHLLGLKAQNAVRGRIRAGIAPPLSPRTVYARLHRKKNRRTPGPMTPLIDEGNFIRSIGYVVKV